MNRREFLQAMALGSCSFLMPGLETWAVESRKANPSGEKLVVVFLRGAIDGLSVLVPYSDQRYYSIRSKTALQKPGSSAEAAIKLDSDFALHPSLSPLAPYWQNKSLAFVLNSGSPDPTRSHFDAQDYMETGIPGNKKAGSGWLNRLLSQLPDNRSPVRAINVGATTPRILQGPVAAATYAPSQRGRRLNPLDRPQIADAFAQMYEGRNDDLEKAFLEGMEARATIKSKLESPNMQDEMTAANQGAPPANKFGGFGKQLGKLMHEEPKVQVGFVALGGFDTHVNQGNEKGQLANHLNVLGKGLAELAQGLGPSLDKTLVMVISEFGRTVKENGNGGTDHGHGNAIWLLGGRVSGGRIYGNWNGIAQSELFEGRDLPVHTDFRAVLSSVLGEHMRLSESQLAAVFPQYSPEPQDKKLSSLLRA